MEKSGWKLGKGIGKEESGMITPLIAFKTNSSTAVIRNSVFELGDVLDPVIKEKLLQKQYWDAYIFRFNLKRLNTATCVVVLTNMLSPKMYDVAAQEDIEMECQSLGVI
jgi:hypothetical protein